MCCTDASHYRAGIILRYHVNVQSHTGNLKTSFPLKNKTNKDKTLRNMVLSFVYSPTVGLSEHMSAFGKIAKLIFLSLHSPCAKLVFESEE